MRSIYGDEILQNFDEFNAKDALVWIDPLDGTKDFTLGNLSAVTVLIGLVINGIPKIGIVHNPFKTNENNGKGSTIFGTQEHGSFYLDFDSKTHQNPRNPTYIFLRK